MGCFMVHGKSLKIYIAALCFAAAALVFSGVRPDRSYPRNIKPSKLQGFYPNYKRTR